MKLHYEDCYTDERLKYQRDAIESVCDLFTGQEICRSEFSVVRYSDDGTRLFGQETDLGIGNRLQLLDEELLCNLNKVQLRNGLQKTEILASRDFTVEMETGTGKTYVYLRTIHELNKRYGFTKFVIVVPSIAIKEGVFASIESMKEHFRGLYAGEPITSFIYNSTKMGEVRNFATSPQIQIMIVTVGAINKQDVNNLYKTSEKTGDDKPIDLIRATSPIVIVDEPQSVDGGLKGKGKEALGAMDPLCTLRYSATHVDKYNMLYRLDAVDAYEQRLVKQIEVASATVENAHNRPYVRLIDVINKRGRILAEVELDIASANGVRRQRVQVMDGDKLEQTTGREVYENVTIGELIAAKGREQIELRIPGEVIWLSKGQSYGDVDQLSLQRHMIRRTIREHLDKEKRLLSHGIKVLSLFFIDTVSMYRQYDDAGNAAKGPYATIFEEEYRSLAKHPDYTQLFEKIDVDNAAAEVHGGYFSIDKKGSWQDTADNNQLNRDNAERAYKLIMKKKEELLKLETPLKFIFSHSALKEGWDNPNVFQICALRDMQSERERRQTIGRGLRLCVNQDGERLRGFDYNTLTVIATESYEQFAEGLQREIETDSGIRFGVIEPHQFANIVVHDPHKESEPLGYDRSKELWEWLRDEKYIDSRGKVQDSLRTAIKGGNLCLPEEFKQQTIQVYNILRKIAGRLDIKNADEKRIVHVFEDRLGSEEFKQLWNRIKYKTMYRVEFDNQKLITECIKAVTKLQHIPNSTLQWSKADIEIGKGGVSAKSKEGSAAVGLDEGYIELPDLLTELQDRTQLTRRSIYRIITESGRLTDFKRNPQQFIAQVARLINVQKQEALVDGIKYQQMPDAAYYRQELFIEEELNGYLRSMVDVKRSITDQIVYGSGVEKKFAEDMDSSTSVKLFLKLPNWFKIPTPLGPYNPDWAVLLDTEQGARLYFVIETKGSLFSEDIRDTEDAKIRCGEVHFEALRASGEAADFRKASNFSEFLTMLN